MLHQKQPRERDHLDDFEQTYNFDKVKYSHFFKVNELLQILHLEKKNIYAVQIFNIRIS